MTDQGCMMRAYSREIVDAINRCEELYTFVPALAWQFARDPVEIDVGHEERFAARRATGDRVWKILREWCPWDEANDQLERCFQVTLVPAEQRGAEWDPMDIDDESFYTSSSSSAMDAEEKMEIVDDPMDLD